MGSSRTVSCYSRAVTKPNVRFKTTSIPIKSTSPSSYIASAAANMSTSTYSIEYLIPAKNNSLEWRKKPKIQCGRAYKSPSEANHAAWNMALRNRGPGEKVYCFAIEDGREQWVSAVECNILKASGRAKVVVVKGAEVVNEAAESKANTGEVSNEPAVWDELELRTPVQVPNNPRRTQTEPMTRINSLWHDQLV